MMMQNDQRSLFKCALELARQIVSRGDDTTELQKAVMALDEQWRRKLVFEAATECLRPSMKMEVPGVFGVAYPARMMHVAHTVNAIRNAMKAGGLGLADLVKTGLLELKSKEREGKPPIEWVVAHLGHEALREAAATLREQDNLPAAAELERHLAYGEEKKLRSEARREAAAEAAKKAAEAETEAQAEKEKAAEAKRAAEASETEESASRVTKKSVRKSTKKVTRRPARAVKTGSKGN